jgi:hypothetical protein
VQQAVKSQRSSTYAVASDFCRIFAEEMNDLYVLSFLLTANSEPAEQCFLGALDDCYTATTVFKDWAHSWARRAVIQNAIRIAQPGKQVPAQRQLSEVNGGAVPENGTALPAILKLGLFERFVYVLSVLEHYSDQEVKTLLDCTRHDVIQARTRALKHVGEWGKRNVLPITSGAGQMWAQAS